MRILIAEDETELAKGLKFLLEKNKFTVDMVHDGAEALAYFRCREYDVVILDIMMPEVDGLEILKRIREAGSGVPVLMLTAKAEIEDRVAGLEAGADDYLPKPFASPEFIARVKALSRRNAGYTEVRLSFGQVWLDCNRYEMACEGRAVRLNADGRAGAVSRDFISSVDEETARAYAQAVLSKGRERGYYETYRYLVSRSGEGITVLFLNAAVYIQSMRSLLFVSLMIGFGSLLTVFLLILFFSRRAIRPFVKNMERQKQFITDAGHELKTPITSIATSADIAAMEHEGDEWIDNIRRQAARLTKLVGDMVALSRLDEETPFPEKSRFSVSEAAWETAEPFAVLAKAKGKRYSQHIEENLTLYGDRASIQRMISILLDNAVRYSDDGGEIRMQIYRRRNKVCIEVSNTCDLPDVSDLDRLFDRFYRLDESRSAATGGTGIGLSMVRAIAETHGGKASVQSADGKEICFKIVL